MQDYIDIRGKRLSLRNLVDARIRDTTYLKQLRREMSQAAPFPHLVIDGWFDPDLLVLMREEFDLKPAEGLTAVRNPHESTFRTRAGTKLGIATEIYFGIVNSGWFVEALAHVCGLNELIPDVGLLGGGMHETRAGGSFDVHRDFDRHPRSGLANELVVITYLNPDWQHEWGGALELWDAAREAPAKSVFPTLGRTLLMRRTETSYHGHPKPLTSPQGVSRRSVASYYYSNSGASLALTQRVGTDYLHPKPIDRARSLARLLIPPVLWSLLRIQLRR